MKNVLLTTLLIGVLTFCHSQSTTIQSNQTDTAKATTTTKRKTVQVYRFKANATQAGPIIRTPKNQNSTGNREEENSTTPK